MLTHVLRSGHSRWALALAVFVAAACKTESTPTPGSGATAVAGLIADSTGAPLAGAAVTVGAAKTTSADDGTFSVDVTGEEKVLVDVTKTGYLESSRMVPITTGVTANVLLALMPLATPVPLDSTKGGKVTGTRGATLNADPNVFVDANGKAVSGTVQVSLTPLSPAMPGEFAAYPGTLAGSKNGAAPALLHTYGVLDVTVTQGGQPVQVASGHTVAVTIPVAGSGTMPKTQDLWSYNLATGIWDYEGTAQLSGSTYTANLAHFSYHNIDAAVMEGQATCVTGLVVDASGNPVAGAYVSPPEGASVDLLITTDSTGAYCTWIDTGQSETISASGTSTPYGQGTVTVTGGAAIPYPGTESCSNLDCTHAPNIVLNQPPCKTDSDCSGGATCCTASGQKMCLQSFACELATGKGGAKSCKTNSECASGDVCCAVSSSTTACLTVSQCSLVMNGACGSGSASAKVGGYTSSWNCYTAELAGTGASQAVLFTGTNTGSTLASTLAVTFTSPRKMSAGETVTLRASTTDVSVAVTAKDASGNVYELSGDSGSLKLASWSTTTGGDVTLDFNNVGLSGVITSKGGGTKMTTGTLNGSATSHLILVP